MEVGFARKESWKQSLVSCWRFLSVRRSRKKDGSANWRIELSLRRSLILGLFLGAVLYAVAVTALYAWRSRVPHNQVRLVDIALPWNWPQMNKRLSMTNFKQAEYSLEQKEYKEAFVNVRAAVGRDPANLKARLLLASMLVGSNPDSAVRILRLGYKEGIPEDENYNSLFLALSLRLEDFGALREVLPLMIEQIRGEKRTDEVTRRMNSYYVVLIQSQMKLQDYVGALHTLDRMEKDELGGAVLPLRLLLLIRMGAFEKFDSLVATLPLRERNSPEILMLRAQAAYERGEIQDAQTYIGRTLGSQPQNWSVYVDGIRLLLRMGQMEEAERVVDTFLHNNGSNLQAIQRLAAALTDWPSSHLVNKIKLWSLIRQGQMYPMLLFFEMQALFREGNFIDAKERFESWISYVPPNHKDYRYVDAYRALFDAVFASGESNRQRLLDTLIEQARTGTPYQEEIYWVAADAMGRIGRYDLADSIITQGMSVYPNTLTLGSLRRKLREARLGVQNPNALRGGQATGWQADETITIGTEMLENTPIPQNSGSGVIFNLED